MISQITTHLLGYRDLPVTGNVTGPDAMQYISSFLLAVAGVFQLPSEMFLEY